MKLTEEITGEIARISALKEEPYYLYDTGTIREQCRFFREIPYPEKSVHYATMAGIHPHILALVREEGLHVFVNSVSHIRKVLRAGFRGRDIVFTASAQTVAMVRETGKKGVRVNLDSPSQLDAWEQLFPGKPAGIRCNIGDKVPAIKKWAGTFIGRESRLGFTAGELAARGYVELLLLGQTVNSYADRAAGVGFAGLLGRLAGIAGIRRIRFTSPHPGNFTDDLLEVLVSCPQVCNHIHLPVQSGSSRVLRLMRRGYTREDYLDIVRKIRAAPREIALSTDLIVGFPGETESDFEDTLSLLDAVQYDGAYSFKYSQRPHTEALNFPDEIPEDEKGRRLDLLQRKQALIQYSRNAPFEQRRMEVLVEGRARSRVRLTGRAQNNKIVNFDGPDSLIGQFVEVDITGFSSNSLKGTLSRRTTP